MLLKKPLENIWILNIKMRFKRIQTKNGVQYQIVNIMLKEIRVQTLLSVNVGLKFVLIVAGLLIWIGDVRITQICSFNMHKISTILNSVLTVALLLKKIKGAIIWHVDAAISIVGFVCKSIMRIITNIGLSEDVQYGPMEYSKQEK